MNALFFIFSTLFLITLQTVILPGFSFFPYTFDLLLIIVLFLSLISTHFSTAVAVSLMGIVMDSLSGVPFFYFTFSYLWVFMIVQLVKQFLFKQSRVFIVIISLVSVLIQQGLFVFSVLIRSDTTTVPSIDMTMFIYSAVLGTLLIPAGIWILSVLFDIWKVMTRSMQKKLVKLIEGDL